MCLVRSLCNSKCRNLELFKRKAERGSSFVWRVRGGGFFFLPLNVKLNINLEREREVGGFFFGEKN